MKSAKGKPDQRWVGKSKNGLAFTWIGDSEWGNDILLFALQHDRSVCCVMNNWWSAAKRSRQIN